MKDSVPMKAALLRRPSFWIILVAALLIVAIVGLLLLDVLTSAPPVYSFEGATLTEDVFGYWLACLKYVYQVRYKSLGIVDSEAGWQTLGADGVSYEETFRAMIDEELRLRFVAATLFDEGGYTLSDASYERLDTLVEELKTEAFGEVPFRVLSDVYGVSKRAVKQVALYEEKYDALYENLFADESIVYAEEYRETLAEFYQKYYYRYNVIYVADTAGSVHIANLESALAGDVTEERFTQLERDYKTGGGVTSGAYPNGIYLYAGENYANAFSEELLSAFSEADEVGKIVKKRDKNDSGSYYVMRYALDDAPYLSENTEVKSCFKSLPRYAGLYLYRSLLAKELPAVLSHGVAETYTVWETVSCKSYNVVTLLGN